MKGLNQMVSKMTKVFSIWLKALINRIIRILINRELFWKRLLSIKLVQKKDLEIAFKYLNHKRFVSPFKDSLEDVFKISSKLVYII